MRYKQKRVGDGVYHTQKWRKLRKLKYGIEHGICEWCNAPGDIVDHIEEITEENANDPEITFNLDNLQLLCLSCHNKKTFKKHFSIREGLRFDETGQLVEKT